jgi:hypothetical protein
MSDTPESNKAKIAFTSLFANDDAYWVPFKVSCKLERERDEALSDLEFRRDLFKLQEQQLNDVRVRAERYRLDANRLEAEVMMLKEKLKEYDDTLTVCTDNFSCKTFVPQKWELPPYDEQGNETPIE